MSWVLFVESLPIWLIAMVSRAEQLAENNGRGLIVKFDHLTAMARVVLVAAGVADLLRTAKEWHPQNDNITSEAEKALDDLGV